MREWRARVVALAVTRPVVMVTIVATAGSTPRARGARMIVHGDGVIGSIGGGQLEYQEIAVARALLQRSDLPDWYRSRRRVILGPDAGQCCGGVVDVLHERIGVVEAHVLAGIPDGGHVGRPYIGGEPLRAVEAIADMDGEEGQFVEPVAPKVTAIYIYGGGHVARALVPLLCDLPFAITWIDIERSRMPSDLPSVVTAVVADCPRDVAARAPSASQHLVMTHSHDLDYEICRALLPRDDLGIVGLIGSATKRARFVQRLRRDGLDDGAVARLVCPIGLAGIPGKSPMAIAIATAAQLLTLVRTSDIS